ncbi:MAG: Rieske (2Fe-2S) protein [Candidatus Hydrogenedentes bacterium]|nr:Rieske (2Fe-2S) protein [Candidatus Hydrogenedentota bacterium]
MAEHEHAESGGESRLQKTRRAFVRLMLSAVGAAYAGLIAYPIYRFLGAPARRAEGMAAVTQVTVQDGERLRANEAKMFRFGTRPAMLIHHADNTWVAFDAVCTHLGCTVQFQADKQRIHCACHGGTYDMHTGRNIGGPPPKPLKAYKVEMKDGQVVVSRA